MSRARYGFKDTRTGQVQAAFDKECALRACDGSLTGRYVAVVWCGDEWRELLNGAPARPPHPRRAPRRAAGVSAGTPGLVLRLWRKLRPDSGPTQEFIRHNGSR